ncbi:PLP-dependent transferase [Gloeophyllum trabeum ATCC 11539]|uniref:PLP-dependent transferase n=1 Tax=Gloeophyllum trabeum (strain ATCC 11539 / FP-39264 / Madison 617) TaxID=670483 RepID=S7QIP6_GLOTA|nr:PLP-dependent transferase [Gloeophyllum trabeum ATCC 11539]EPQ59207.1 PLP-dependent transferase [Gloeophyllum trabeum ATCC 11539]
MSLEKQPNAVDLSRHLSDMAKARQTSPLKGLAKYMGRPNMIALAGGMPNPGYFPFSTISADVLVPDSFPVSSSSQSSSLSWLWKIFGAGSKEKTTSVSIPKYVKNPRDDVNLATALQYGTATGLVPLQKFLHEFVSKVYQPAYADFETLVQTGNTDGWNRAALTLCNPGEVFLTEEWTYPSALSSVAPLGITAHPVPMDKEGMRSDSLRQILEEWDEAATGKKRPHVMYTVPVGQNPSGATMGYRRKKEIYDICVEFDIIIVEDDPYYFLQEGVYQPKSARTRKDSPDDDISHYIAGLVPSYLKLDYQGRVIRLDTFSKTIAPGSRLGWFTCNAVFAERLERAGEVSTQAPCGFGQSLITSLLLNWGFEGYVRWLRGLGAQYTARRDFFIDAFAEEFDLDLSTGQSGAWRGCDVYLATEKVKPTGEMSEKFALTARRPLFSFVPPTSGMFVWLKVHFENHPKFRKGDDSNEMKLWIALAESGLLIAPGWFFAADQEDSPDGPDDGHYRIAFSFNDFDDMKKAVQIFGRVVREHFKDN